MSRIDFVFKVHDWDVLNFIFLTFQIQNKKNEKTGTSLKRKLIITTGDTSDVDGFLALAEYSKVPFTLCALHTDWI